MTRDDLPTGRSAALNNLTAREWDCLRLLGKEMSAKQAAATLAISYSTFNKHLASVRAKLGVRRTAHAVLLCQRYHWTGDDPLSSTSFMPFAEQSQLPSEYLSDLQACLTFEEAWKVFNWHTARFGVHSINFGVVAAPFGAVCNSARMIAMSLPDEIKQIYDRNGGMNADPFAVMISCSQLELNLRIEAVPPEIRAAFPPLLRQFSEALCDYGISNVLGQSMRDQSTGAAFAMPFNLPKQTAVDAERHSARYFALQRDFSRTFWSFVQDRKLLRDFVALTTREREALQHVARGFKNFEIAEHMNLSIRSVEKTLASAREALMAPTTAAAVYRAQVYRALF